MAGHDEPQELRALPSVERLLQTEPLRSAAAGGARPLATDVVRELLARCREEIRAGDGAAPAPAQLAAQATAALRALMRPRLVPVINATGVVIHTNLGRAPLPAGALDALDATGSGYSNLEYEVQTGTRGSRQAHIEWLLCELTGAEAAIAVNNNAAAVLLAVAALAGGREVVVSRGQLVEIGGSFRIPEILEASGARLVEVGTTNRTRIADYEHAIGPATAALMRVHQSNFRTVGFTAEASLEELAELAGRHDVAVIDDAGSGVLNRIPGRLGELLRDEPAATESLAAGADVVCLSGDKLLGGPQAGIAAGRAEVIERMRRHPLARAVRIDKLSLAALEATLRLHRDPDQAAAQVPVLEMLAADEHDLLVCAARIHDALAAGAPTRTEVKVIRSAGRAGGGSLPLLELEGPVVSVRSDAGAHALAEQLRMGEPAVIGRVQDDAVLIDPRTVSDVEVDFLVRAVRSALHALA